MLLLLLSAFVYSLSSIDIGRLTEQEINDRSLRLCEINAY